MISSVNDTYRVYSNNVSSKWVEDGKVQVDDNIMKWVDDSKKLVDAKRQEPLICGAMTGQRILSGRKSILLL